MAVIQMTRAEYEKKYGAQSVVTSPSLDTTPSISKMTQAEFLLKYGEQTQQPENKKIGMLDINPKANPFTVSNPLTDINAAGGDVNEAITGTGKYTGQGAIQRGTSAAATAAMTVPSVAADLIPGGKTALDLIGKGFEKATNFAGNIGNMFADTAQKIGIMSPEQRKQYDQRNADFVNSPTGVAIDSVASVGKNLGDIANVILMAHGTAQATQNFIDKTLPEMKQKYQEAKNAPPPPSAQASMDADRASRVANQANEIAAVEDRYSKGRKMNRYSTNEGADSRARIAETNVLQYSVDENGMIRTQQTGGAVDKYKAMTTKPSEGVVRANLVRLGEKTNLSEVETYLKREVNSSGLEGADLVNALNGLKKEVAGLRLKADDLGYVPNEVLHDAKINTTDNINFQTPPETATYRKAVARAYKTLVEDNSSFNVAEVNGELSKYYGDIERLKALDGMRVQGGRLGKYTAQVTGTIVGGAVGGLFGGLGGAALGTVVGGEAAGFMKGKAMANTFTEVPAKTPTSPILEKAIEQSKLPQESNLGNRNTSQSTKTATPNTSKGVITPKSTTIPPELQPLAKEAQKYSSAEDFISKMRGSSTQWADYSPEVRKFGIGDTSKRITDVGIDPEMQITVYRGIDDLSGKVKRQINEGDFVIGDFDQALAYTGSPKDVVTKTIKAKDLIVQFPDEFAKDVKEYGLKETLASTELIYSDSKNPIINMSKERLTEIWEKANKK